MYGLPGPLGTVTDETGLMLMGWRYYDPQTGRFLTKDPIGYAGGLNLYGYAGGNPVNFVDPLGLWATGSYWGDVGQVFLGYWDVINPVNAYHSVVGLYGIGTTYGANAALCALGQGIVHGYTDWVTTSDPRAFGQSFGTVLSTAAAVAAPMARATPACFVEGEG